MTGIGIKELEDLGIDTVIIAGADMQGRLFGKRMSPKTFRSKLDEGLHICTCVYAWDIAQALEGVHVDFTGAHTGWHDFRLVPDLSTLRRAAWLDGTAICLGDATDEDGEPLPIAPRSILRRQVEGLAAQGLTAAVATELEFHLFLGRPEAIRSARYRDLTPTTLSHADYNVFEGNAMDPFFRGLRRALDESEIPVDVAQVEYGLGQWEINLQHADPVAMADRHVLYKLAVKDSAAANGYTATFMPRPFADEIGSSCHIHASLEDEVGRPVFHDDTAERGASAELLSAVGGALDHAAELMCWYAPTINSYKRTSRHDFAGNGLTWGFDNRTVSVRVLTGHPGSTRMEFRVPGADVNPYLALAGLLASMHDGMDKQTDPGPPRVGDAYEHASNALPTDLSAAADLFGRSPWVADTFGRDVVRHYEAMARFECERFSRTVTDWELDRYFEAI
ncbi:MAG: glutamine synthetase [Anaerolinea sp.]|jgi:glutamine synthetase|nr:glutamine synthetase [Anaerolinea sp.]